MSAAESMEADAADWLIRQEGEAWSAADEQALAAWLESDTRRRVAYLRLQATWKRMDRLAALKAPPSVALPQRPPRRRWVIAGAIGLAVLTLGPVAFWQYGRGDVYRTSVGATELVSLEDGSHVDLNTGTELRVALSSGARRIDLLEGEAFFAVRKDSERPFVVTAGDYEVTAVGTAFSVRREGLALGVLVSEGVVRVANKEKGAGGQDGLVKAGEAAEITGGQLSITKVGLPAVLDVLSWRDRLLTFEDRPISEIIREFNRYREAPILVDPMIADLRFDGVFRVDNADGFVRMIEANPEVAVRRADGQIHLVAQESS